MALPSTDVPSCCGAVFKVDATGNESVLYNFTGGWGGTDGQEPEAGLVQDAQGNLYGTTYYGGDRTCNASWGCGTVFKVDTTGRETVIHSFTGGEGDGALPAAGLVQDAQGNLYGTTYYGGANWCGVPNQPYGCGTVFKLDTNGNETLLHSFEPARRERWLISCSRFSAGRAGQPVWHYFSGRRLQLLWNGVQTGYHRQ